MRILIDCSNYFLDNDNLGDRAIYQVMVKRLLQMWPDAAIALITLDPALVSRTCPHVQPFVLRQRHDWQIAPPRPSTRSLICPRTMWNYLSPRQWNTFAGRTRWQWQMRRTVSQNEDARRLQNAVAQADLVLASGGGYFSDCFSQHAVGVLDTLALALRMGKPAAIFGAGFEPVADRALCEKARDVLPSLRIIACREGRTGPEVLRSFGVCDDRIRVTGDDAIELAHDERPARLGAGLGVNLRAAEYSGVGENVVAAVRQALLRFSLRLPAHPVPAPISLFGPSDPDAIHRVLHGILPTCTVRVEESAPLECPEAIARQVGRCRVVFTGSYHAAVFALSQGIPVVALAKSTHYAAKFGGLQTQFPQGCAIIDATAGKLGDAIDACLLEAWRSAEALRPLLLQAAGRQIQTGQQAYLLLAARIGPGQSVRSAA